MKWNLYGHDKAISVLERHIAQNDLRHAYMFTGPPGIGKRTLAIRFAQGINCLEPPEPGRPCLTCRICRHIGKMQHVDLTVVEADCVGGILKVEQVRELQNLLSLTPYDAGYRIALLLRFQEANQNAQNALLKTLEEAPRKAILLLTADSAESLLPTISSRCEILRLHPLPVPELAENLRHDFGLGQEESRKLAHYSEGRMGYALRLYEIGEDDDQRSGWIEELMQLMNAPMRERFKSVQSFSRSKEDFRACMLVWLSFWRDVMLKASGCDAAIVNIDKEEDIEDIANKVGLLYASQRVSDLEQGLSRLDGNINTRLLGEILMLDL